MATFLDENTPFRLPEDVISKLDRLEVEAGLPDLDSIYDEVYQKNTRVDSRDRENVIKTFNFMLYSFIDWYLHDLANAISVGVDGRLNLAIDASYVLDICSNFLVVDHSGYVQFAHLSVPEYLKGGRSAIVFSDMDAHAQIAEVCLAYVMSPSAQETVKQGEFDRRQVLHQEVLDRKALYPDAEKLKWFGIPAEDIHVIWRDDPLSLHMYAFALCLEHCELASVARHQKGRALCSLFATFMSSVEINPAFLTWIQPSPNARTFPRFPPNWTAEKAFAHYRTKRGHTRADPQDTFFAACAYGFTDILQDMMRSGVNVDVNRRNEDGAPGFGVASRCGQFPVVELLLDEGADYDISRDRYGFTPLYEAAVWGHPNIVDLLLSRGADASARFKGSYNYVYNYVKYDRGHGIGREDAEDQDDKDNEENIVDADFEICEADETLLHAILGWVGLGEKPINESKMSSIMNSLLEHGASIEATNSSSATPLNTACQNNKSAAVSILLHHDACLGAPDRDGRTPLICSVACEASSVVLELLLKKASIADIVRRDNDGHSVLSYSIFSQSPNLFNERMLLLNTVDLRAVRELGTQDGDEFAELSDIITKIGYDAFLDLDERYHLDIAYYIVSQRSVIICLQAIAEHLHQGVLDWNNADFCDKLRKAKIPITWTGEGNEDDTDDDDDDDADDDKDMNSDDDEADDDDTDSKNL